MSKKILVKADGGLLGTYNVQQQRPSFLQLGRRAFKDPDATTPQRLGALAGMGGKIGAAGVAGFQTAHGLQGGNLAAPLQGFQTYAGLDPTLGQPVAVTPQEQLQQMTEQRRKQRIQEANEDYLRQQEAAMNRERSLRARQNQPPGVPLPTQEQQESMRTSRPVEDPSLPPGVQPLQAPIQVTGIRPMPQPTQPTQPTDTVQQTAQVVSGLPTLGEQPIPALTQPTQQPAQSQQPVNSTSTQTSLKDFTGQQPTQQYDIVNNPYKGIQWGSQQAMEDAMRRDGLIKSFAIQVLDEFGDILYKADPHIAGIVAMQVYIDKVMKE